MRGRLGLAVALNLIFVGVELAYGFIANSIALIAVEAVIGVLALRH